MKSKRALLNVIINTVAQILNIVLAFVVRRTFSRMLGDEVLGLNSLFSSILAFLTLSELGIGTSISMCLFKPLAESDEEKIAAYMQLLKKIYIVIGFVIMVAGAICSPFLKYLVNGNFEIRFLITSFGLYVFSTAITYFYSYKKILLGADQKNYIVSAANLVYKIVINVAQYLVLVLTRNYQVFLVVAIICNFTENCVTSYICDQHYPYIGKYHVKLTQEEKRDIMSKIKGMLSYKISNYMIEGTDNIILSAVLGTVFVAYYNNYYLIINMLYAVFACVATSSVAGLGNILYTDKKTLKFAFSKLLLVQHFVYSFSTTAFAILATDFVKEFFGEKSILPQTVVLLMVAVYYIKGYSQAIESVRNCAGEYQKDKYLNLFIALLNVIISILGAIYCGIAGILIGTLVCYIIKEIIVVPNIVFSNIIVGQKRWYFKTGVQHFVITCIIIMICEYIHTHLFIGNVWITWIANGLMCVVVSVGINIAVYHKTEEFLQLKGTLLKIIKRNV